MQTAVEAHMAQKYRISDKNDKEVFDFLKQNFGCNRKVYNLCVDSSKLGIDGAAKTIIQTVQIFDSTK